MQKLAVKTGNTGSEGSWDLRSVPGGTSLLWSVRLQTRRQTVVCSLLFVFVGFFPGVAEEGFFGVCRGYGGDPRSLRGCNKDMRSAAFASFCCKTHSRLAVMTECHLA